VLYTERQRLELHPDLDWPFRVSGTQIGVLSYQQKYGRAPQRRTNLDGDAIADERFRAFFQGYGGLPVFGYPISPLLDETRIGGQQTVQYFERARFELAPNSSAGASLLEQVRLGALGQEYPGIAALCPGQPASMAPAAGHLDREQIVGQPRPQAAPASAGEPIAAGVVRPPGRAWWFWPLAGLIGLLFLGTAAWGLQIRADIRARKARAARAGRSAGTRASATPASAGRRGVATAAPGRIGQ
jgi:hypothetical protein